MMTLSLPSEIANTFQIANRFHSARTGSATVESMTLIPPTNRSKLVRNLGQFSHPALVDRAQVADR